MNKYLKKYQKKGEVEKFSISFGDDPKPKTNVSNIAVPPYKKTYGYIQPASAWTHSIQGGVTPLDVLPGIMQMGNAFKELFEADPYKKALRQERRKRRKLNKKQEGGDDLWDDDGGDDWVDDMDVDDPWETDDPFEGADPDDLDDEGLFIIPEEEEEEEEIEYYSPPEPDTDPDDDPSDVDFGDDGGYDGGMGDDGGMGNEGEGGYQGREGAPQQQQQGEKKAFWDRKVPKFFRKFSHAAVSAAKPLNALLRLNQTRKQMAQLNYATIAGNKFATTPADMSGSKGDWTTNEGYFRPDDRIPVRSDFGRYGGEMFELNDFLNFYGMKYNNGGELPKASDGREWLANNYPGYDDLNASEKAQLNYQMEGTTYNFMEDLYNFQNPMNRNEVTNTMSYPFPEFMREYDNFPARDTKNRDWSEYNQSWSDNPNANKYYKHRWSKYGDWDSNRGWGKSENRKQGIWTGLGTTVTDPTTGKEVNWRKGPWEGFYSGYSWMPDDPISLSEAEWNLLVETGAYNPKYIDKRGRWSRAKNDYVNKDADAYMVWEDVLRKNYPELTTMQIHDLMHSGVHRQSMRGGRKGSPWAPGIPTPGRMKDPDYKWGEYGDVLFDVRTTMPPGSREPGPTIPYIPPTNQEETIVTGPGMVNPGFVPGYTIPNTIPTNYTGYTGTPPYSPTGGSGSGIISGTTRTGDDGYVPSRDYGYVPQTQRSRDEMNATAYGTSGSPQSQQDDDDTAYVPQTQRDDDDDNDAKYGGFFYGNGGEAEIDINTYKQLIAAGADIQIL
jgi:hypothetical protein